jgi:hypothetical protein
LSIASGSKDARLHGGFSERDLMLECLKFFENGTAKLTIEFVNTHVMQIQRDIRKILSQSMVLKATSSVSAFGLTAKLSPKA